MKVFTACVLWFATLQLSLAQELILEDHTHKVGASIGYGSQSGLDANYDYQVQLYQLEYYLGMFETGDWSFELIAQPQFNVTSYSRNDINLANIDGFEFGVNAALKAKYFVFEDALGVYALIGTGPHYVSGVPERQAPGFIFSDNFFAGLDVKVVGNLHLDLRWGFRHISNASLRYPNGGVNNIITNVGFYTLL